METFNISLEALLTQLVHTQDSKTVRDATHSLESQFYVTKDCVPTLLDITASSVYCQVRQLAAVELRKRIRRWWSALEPVLKDNLRSKLLETLLKENDRKVQHSITRVISSIAENDFWPDLVPFTYQAAASSNVSHRDIGLYCIYILFKKMPDYFINNTLFDLLKISILDQQCRHIRVNAVLILGRLSEYVDSKDTQSINMFKKMVPSMVNVLEECIKYQDIDNTVKLFEVFDTFLMLDAPLLSDHFIDLIDFFLSLSSDTRIIDQVRELSISFLMWASIYKPNQIKKLKLIEPILEAMMLIGTEQDPEDIDEDSPSRLAYKVINGLATGISSQHFFLSLISCIVDYSQNGDAKYRKSGMMAFAVSIEGCLNFIAARFDQCMSLICCGLQDPDITVRRAACMGLGCLAEDMASEVSEYHAILLPLILSLMDDSEMVNNLCCVLDAIIESTDTVECVPIVMEKLLCLLQEDLNRACVLTAIGSTANAAREAFEPYFSQLMPVLVQYMSTQDPDEVHILRSVATDVVRSVAEAVPGLFGPYLHQIMSLAIQQLDFGSTRLNECSFALFTSLCRHQDISDFLPSILPKIIQTFQSNDQEDNLESMLDDEKELAVDALGELFAHTRHAFLPYFDTSLTELLKLIGDPFEGVRKAAVQSLFTFLKTAHDISDHSSFEYITHTIVPMVIEFWREEEVQTVESHTCDELAEALDMVGPVVVSECIEAICNHLLLIYQKISPCQLDVDEEEEEEEEEEEGFSLIGSASNLIASLCQSIGPDFSGSFEIFLPYILDYGKSGQTEQAMVIGCLGECIVGIKEAITPHTENLLRIFTKACIDKDELVRSNAAFSLGCLTFYTQVDLSANYPQLLSLLSPLFSNQNLPNTVDNATGAVARLIMAHPNSVPLEQVLPVFIQALPLKSDYKENEPVFDCIFKLFSAKNPLVLGALPQFLHIFHIVLSDKNDPLSTATRNHLLELVRVLNSSRPDMNIASTELALFL